MVQIRPADGGLLQQLLYADEVRLPRMLDIDSVEASDAELKLALQWIEQGARAAYDPHEFVDEEKQRILGGTRQTGSKNCHRHRAGPEAPLNTIAASPEAWRVGTSSEQASVWPKPSKRTASLANPAAQCGSDQSSSQRIPVTRRLAQRLEPSCNFGHVSDTERPKAEEVGHSRCQPLDSFGSPTWARTRDLRINSQSKWRCSVLSPLIGRVRPSEK